MLHSDAAAGLNGSPIEREAQPNAELVAEPDAPWAVLATFDVERASHDVKSLSADTFAGRRVGTPGHDATHEWLVERFRALGLVTSAFPFTLDTPVLDLYALPTLEAYDLASGLRRSLRHRTEFTPHPRSADAPTAVSGVAQWFDVRSVGSDNAQSAGKWLILDHVPQGDALAAFAARRASEGAVGLLLPQHPNAEGYLVKRIVAQRPALLPILSVRVDLLQTLTGQYITAAAPVRPTLPHGAHALGELLGVDATLAQAPLIVSAHYDGVGDDGPMGAGGHRFPCATDNAAGVAVLLEVARVLQHVAPRPRRSILFAALDAEEVNAVGSQAYAAALKATGMTPLVINLDGAARWHGVAQVEPGAQSATLLETLDAAGERCELPLTVGAISSDNRRFAAAGFPAVGVSVGLAGMHTPADTSDRVESEAMARVGRFMLAAIWRLAYAG